MSKRKVFGAVVLPGNRGVLVVGGLSDKERLASTELLDTETQTFSPGPSIASRRNCCSAVVMEDGQVVVVGGSNEINVLSTSEVLSPVGNT